MLRCGAQTTGESWSRVPSSCTLKRCLQLGRNVTSEPFVLLISDDAAVSLCRLDPARGLNCEADLDPEFCFQRAEVACEIIGWFGSVPQSIVRRLQYRVHQSRAR